MATEHENRFTKCVLSIENIKLSLPPKNVGQRTAYSPCVAAIVEHTLCCSGLALRTSKYDIQKLDCVVYRINMSNDPNISRVLI